MAQSQPLWVALVQFLAGINKLPAIFTKPHRLTTINELQ